MKKFIWYVHLFYKHQWNTRWAFAQKHDIFTHVKISPHLSQDKTVSVKWFGIFGVYIINRTLYGRLEIWNFSSRVVKYFQHSKRNFISPRGHVISSICLTILEEDKRTMITTRSAVLRSREEIANLVHNSFPHIYYSQVISNCG